MKARRLRDEALRARALERLAPPADALAREVLERGAVDVEHEVTSWEGSHGRVRGHRVVVVVPEELARRVEGRYAVSDALTAALAASVAERRGEAAYDVVIEGSDEDLTASGGPYRTPR